MRDVRVLMAEAVGSFILILGGPGTAVLAGDRVGTGFIALAFGFSLLVAVYTVGPVSGCHVNPAVTLAAVVMRVTPVAKVPAYITGQLMGGLLGALTILWIRKGAVDDFDADPLNFSTNLWGSVDGPAGPVDFFGFGAMVVAEIVLTAVLVFVFLAVTDEGEAPDYTGLALGVTFALVHFVAIPVDNASVNPMRSFVMAVFAGGEAIEQVWAFILFPLLGAVLGTLVWLAVDDSSLEDTVLGRSRALLATRDAATKVTDAVEEGLDSAGDILD